jgi:hypothetical protein
VNVLDWLMDSDPAVRWQVLRDLRDAPADQVATERRLVSERGWGAKLLTLQLGTGQWDSGVPTFDSTRAASWWRSLPAERRGTLFPEWTSTTWSLTLLRSFGLDPTGPAARRAVNLVAANCRWEHDGEAYFDGEVEPCINGRVVATGSYFGQDTAAIVDRLLTEQMSDGGWNCEQEHGSRRGSFNSTIEVLEGLLEYERAQGPSADVAAARKRGHEYLLERRMLRRVSTGEVIDQNWTQFSFPTYWHYDVLRGLDYLRAAKARLDPRLSEALDLVEGKHDVNGIWPLENPHPGRLHFPIDEGQGCPSRWNTLRAMRVMRWAGRG